MGRFAHPLVITQRLLVIGGGRGGTAMLELFLDDPLVEIVGVMDTNPHAPAMIQAAHHGIACFTELSEAIDSCKPCMVFNLTGDDSVSMLAQQKLGQAAVIGGFQARFLWNLLTRLKQTHEQIAHLAYHDALTGLPNRTLFFDRIGQAIARARRTGARIATLYLDLDGFKSVNDTFGHGVGDGLLKEAAQRIKTCVRESDTAARMGGDEFALILSDIGTLDDARRVTECLLHTLSSPFVIQTHNCQVGASIGVALYPEHATTAEALVKRADAAMYWAKQSGKNRCRVFGIDSADSPPSASRRPL